MSGAIYLQSRPSRALATVALAVRHQVDAGIPLAVALRTLGGDLTVEECQRITDAVEAAGELERVRMPGAQA